MKAGTHVLVGGFGPGLVLNGKGMGRTTPIFIPSTELSGWMPEERDGQFIRWITLPSERVSEAQPNEEVSQAWNVRKQINAASPKYGWSWLV